MFYAAMLTLAMLIASPIAQAKGDAVPTGVDPEKAAAIRELLEVTGAINMSKQMMAGMIESMKPANPGISAKTWERLAVKLDPNELIGEIITIYDQHFSTDDLQAVLAFYKSPAGTRLIAAMPAVITQSMELGKKWGVEKSAELSRELEHEKLIEQKQSSSTEPKGT